MTHSVINNAAPLAEERWSLDQVSDIYNKPFNDLLYEAQSCHRNSFNPNSVQLSTLLNIKTGGCPEDCSYCPQSARYDTGVESGALLSIDDVCAAAAEAKQGGATRFCMGAAWRQLKDKDVEKISEMIAAVKDLGLESCMTLGMLTEPQAQQLKQAGLDYYNHNIDTSRDYYESIISTRNYDDRLATLNNVRNADIKVCCGGIVGMGESKEQRMEFLRTLSNLPVQPESVPINSLVNAKGTPLENSIKLDPFDLVRSIATARILMPSAWIRLSAGRNEMSDELQSLCFHAGANSIFYGEKLLTTDNPVFRQDQELLKRLGMTSCRAE